jgi:hypothetical protein
MKIKTLRDLPAVAAYLDRIGADARSLKTAVVKETNGAYWHDRALIRFDRAGVVECPAEYEPTESEAAKIKDEMAQAEWPKLKRLRSIVDPPPEVRSADPEDVFEFRDRDGMLIMLQVRVELKEKKIYVPWTYWNDDEWRKAEPEGPLPLYGLDKIGSATTVFIHEGAKAARAMQRMVSGETFQDREALREHPWGEELATGAHVGWIGGALSPDRTDWSVLRQMGIKRAYIVSDNDWYGASAVPRISYHLNLPAYHVQFTDQWPASFDLADPWPAHFFAELEGKRRYIGPPFRSCVHPATWMTDLVPNKRGRPSYRLRSHVIDTWAYVEDVDMFVCLEMPDIIRAEAVFNKMTAAFSHTQQTSKLLVSAYRGRTTKLCYRPDVTGRVVTDGKTSAVNTHEPSLVRPEQGDPTPWLDFMTYLIPSETERDHVLRWCATLIARPDIRMSWGLLLVSEQQGIGKNTLGSLVLAPLVGEHNTSWPAENDISESAFNGWAAHKRLVFISEIYSGHSWKAYNKMKSIITDMEIEINQKYMRPYRIENWCHVVACSNSPRALRIEKEDRRWFYPELATKPWSLDRFTRFREWVQAGGIRIIAQWARDYGDYVAPGEPAPMTDRKLELIAESQSEAQREAAELAAALADMEEPAVLTMKSVIAAVRASAQGRVYDSDHELRKAMRDAGAYVSRERVKVQGRLQYVVYNPPMADLLREVAHGDKARMREMLRQAVIEPGRLLGETM